MHRLLIISLLASFYCFAFVSGLLGAHKNHTVTLAAILWFMLPLAVSMKYIIEKLHQK